MRAPSPRKGRPTGAPPPPRTSIGLIRHDPRSTLLFLQRRHSRRYSARSSLLSGSPRLWRSRRREHTADQCVPDLLRGADVASGAPGWRLRPATGGRRSGTPRRPRQAPARGQAICGGSPAPPWGRSGAASAAVAEVGAGAGRAGTAGTAEWRRVLRLRRGATSGAGRIVSGRGGGRGCDRRGRREDRAGRRPGRRGADAGRALDLATSLPGAPRVRSTTTARMASAPAARMATAAFSGGPPPAQAARAQVRCRGGPFGAADGDATEARAAPGDAASAPAPSAGRDEPPDLGCRRGTTAGPASHSGGMTMVPPARRGQPRHRRICRVAVAAVHAPRRRGVLGPRRPEVDRSFRAPSWPGPLASRRRCARCARPMADSPPSRSPRWRPPETARRRTGASDPSPGNAGRPPPAPGVCSGGNGGGAPCAMAVKIAANESPSKGRRPAIIS